MNLPRSVHPFPARMASEIALEALAGLPRQSTVLDPMCGSGVVVRRATDRGHRAIGLDIDPLAVLMTRVWTCRISPSIQPDLGVQLSQRARALLGTELSLPWIDQDRATSEYIDFWFLPAQREQIRALVAAMSQLHGQRKALAKLALSRIIVTKSGGASVARDTSHSRPHRVRTDNDFDVFMGFEKSLCRLLKILRNCPGGSVGRVRTADARTLRGIRSASIDAIVTSPPYLKAIDYLRGHKLSLVWLGYSLSDISRIRSLGVGTRTHHGHNAQDRMSEIVNSASPSELPMGLERDVRSYTADMMSCLKQAYRVLRPEGYAVYVVSNSLLQGSKVDTARIIIESAADAGLVLESRYNREIPREGRYLPPPQVSHDGRLAARMRSESVLRFRKQR